ncbi:MAG TPA: peptidase, partial [Bacteroidetes bacterium]|nr:peptidase [Bacteroidota bacterium]
MKKFLFVLVTLSLSKGVQKGFSQNNLRNYFQQEVDYTIQVKLDDEKNMLRATENLVYINNSPDTLKFIWFHLWANAYKNNNTAFAKQKLENGATDFYFSTEEERGFIDSLDFKVNDESVKLEYDANNIDIARIWLNKPLAPHEQITITTPFRVKIPKTFSRMGRDGQQYQISQWYPKPAVYDRYGWHPIPYLDQGEFYSEYGVLDVFITLPKNYVMDATGELMSDDEKKFLAVKEASSRKYLSLEMSEAQKEIAENDSFSMKFPVSDYEMKTLHFHAEDVHDFAWFADKRYMIVRDVVTLESGKKVATTVLFTSNHTNVWRNSVQFVDSAIYYYSKWIGDYPYPHATAVDGALTAGGGMEYPMITV